MISPKTVLMVTLMSFGPTLLAQEPGQAPPDFELPALDQDQMVKLSDMTGKVVYIDFWASWCGPCRQSLPLYEEMNKNLPADKFQIIAINLDERREDAIRFLDSHPVSYLVLLDPSGDTARQYQVKAMPSSYLVDTGGSVVKAWAGFTPSHIEEIENEIRSLLE